MVTLVSPAVMSAPVQAKSKRKGKPVMSSRSQVSAVAGSAPPWARSAARAWPAT